MAADDPRVWLAEARRQHRAGEVAAALTGYMRVLERMPRHPEVLQLAAMAAAQAGDLPTAQRLARRAVDVRDDDAARLTLGRVLVQSGELEEAWSCLSLIDGSSRQAADAAYHAGQALRRLGRADEAERSLERATRRAPDHAPAWNELGVVRLERGDPEGALACFRESLERRPGHLPTMTNLATAFLRLGDYDGCERTVAEALAAAPADPAAVALLGRLRKSQGRLPEAQRVWQSLVDRDPADVDAWHGLAATLQAAGDLAGAGRAYERALSIDPARPDLVAARAEWLEWQGRYQEGLEALAGLEDAQQTLPGPALVQARLRRRTGQPGIARALLEQAVPATCGDAVLRRQYCFSLGDVCDESGDYEAAWRWYEEGNRLTPASYDGIAHRRWLGTIGACGPVAASDPRGAGVVFIVGMPRSGTSLIEQILAAHPAVHAGGELSTLGELVDETLRVGERPADAVEHIGGGYLAALPALHAGQTFVTDKMPTNFAYLPVIRSALPGARVIHCRRDARDTGLSCFCTDFIDPNLGFATRLDWLADYLDAYRDHMRRWVSRLGGRVTAVDYEDLVRRPEPVIRELLTFLGLDWDDRCLRPHEEDRVVSTASHAQVREPIHTRSIGRWRHYQAHLEPLLALAPSSGQSTSA